MYMEERPYQCNQCDHTYTSKGSMVRHMNIHTGERRYECKECCKQFSTNSNLTKHMRIHTGEKPYQCSHCDKEFSQSSTLKIHERIHTGEKPFKCSYCEKAFSLKFYLTSHMKIHIKKYESTDSRNRLNESDSDPDFNEETKNDNAAAVQRTEVNEVITSTGPTLNFKCTKCDYKSATKFLLVRHTRKHTGEKPFNCPECEYKSAYQSNIDSHIKNLHKWLNTHKNKKGRRKKKHTGEKTFSCPECPYRSTYKNNLNTHIRNKHEWTIEHEGKGEITPELKKYPLRNKYFCKECKLKFHSKEVFENHMLSHIEYSPTNEVKRTEFSDDHNTLNNSEKEETSLHNIDLEDEEFECSMCDYIATSEKDIQAHSLTCDSITELSSKTD